MSHEVKIHEAQTVILRELLFRPTATFATLRKPTGLSGDHFTFHINRLIELDMIEKTADGTYRLSVRGKEYANRLDTDNNTVERQPKSAVILMIERTMDTSSEYLFQQRLKQPYFGYWGPPTGKIRWGETILETAARELQEETGLTGSHELMGVYHEHSYQRESGQLLEDKIFFVVRCTNIGGQLTEDFEGGRNEWMTRLAIESQEKIFDSLGYELEMLAGGAPFVERKVYFSKDHF